MGSLWSAAIAVATLTGVGLLTGCSSGGNQACTAGLAEGHQAVVVGSGIPTSATAQVCDKTVCSSATATSTDRVDVPLDMAMWKRASTVTANVSAGGTQIAAPVTATPTASPSTSTADNGCDVLVDYRYTVTVTPTH
ncbi:hypothetical protein [Branchiibius sp. NY16-3462-2]|uniref:hypothetical protein n=1 Tax=Branchiibius sp. NY16-3462-2 TaxID=1807500 RepID=UPI0025C68BB7|nr:hypothetical protein [Branchiibius sp. NY16-3462-2]